MGEFETVSRLFLLLLGLAIAEVLKGFARVLRLMLKAEDVGPTGVRIGWLVPLLGAMMIQDQVTFWSEFQRISRLLPPSFPSLVALVAIIGAYFALSTLVFPAEPRQWPDFDDYYFKVRHAAVGGILAINALTLAAAMAVEYVRQTGVFDEDGSATAIGAVVSLITLPSMIAPLLLRGRRANLVALLVCNLLLLAEVLPL